MHITIHVDPNFPRWLRRVAVYAGVPAVMAVAAVVYADVAVPNTFAAGDPLSSTMMNANFKALQDGINNYTNPKTGQVTTLIGEPCGVSSPANGAVTAGGKTGYAATRELCMAAPGCSATARICNASEMVLYTSTGGGIDQFTTENAVWMAAGIMATDSGGLAVADCDGFVTGGAGSLGSIWTKAGGPSREHCNSTHRVMCCQ